MSAATEAATTATSRTKATWSGEASRFVQYEEAALLWEQSLTWEKRYTAGPKLVQELTGAAKRFVAGQAAGWVAYRGGVTKLMNHLRQALGKPRVNEVPDLLATYFRDGGDTTATEGRENTQQASSEGETRRRDSRKYQSYIGEANDPPDEDFEENQAAAMEELIAEGLMRKDPAPVAPGMIPTWIAYAAGNGDVEPQIVLTSLWEQLHRWTKGSSNGSYEQAPFVCLAEMTTTTLDEFMPDSLAADFAGYAQSALTADTSEQLMTTQEAVRKGMCVIDGGATQTVGSLAALEAVVDQNRRKHGATKIKASLLIFSTRDNSFLILPLTGKGRKNKIATTELAGIPALNLALVVYLSVILLIAMDSLNKTDLVLHLRAYGEEPPEEWTKMELKQRIKDLMDRGEMPGFKTSKERTPLQVATSELNEASRKKADLIKYVAAEYQIEATSNDTIGAMQRKAMVKIITEMEGDVSIYLKAKAKQSPKGKVMQKGYLTETYEETPSASSTSSDVATLAAVVAQLVQEVKTMKEEKVKNVPDMFEGLLGQQRIELVDV
ncbi:hypothetical protein AK812_SmicGene38790 [Symbiodinium microadriaticum]|uniref:Uncharacterized protein n=1 Tax=Symbiodinium microadriaticum TaxID=2951 RepID=A0A1Q9CCW9_SYMMI|nr:hypothetical protein AK812_SmicGene38790 [Symbiodinium microadriaticum]CAE7195212.1 unnamed protein product [Symbiodinium microadriaticum]